MPAQCPRPVGLDDPRFQESLRARFSNRQSGKGYKYKRSSPVFKRNAAMAFSAPPNAPGKPTKRSAPSPSVLPLRRHDPVRKRILAKKKRIPILHKLRIRRWWVEEEAGDLVVI